MITLVDNFSPTVAPVLGLTLALFADTNASQSSADWLPLISPAGVTLFGLWCLRVLYLWQRKASYRRRERRRKEHPAEKLTIPVGVKKPEEFDGVQTLHECQWTYIGSAVEAQGDYFANGILAAILPATALFLLSYQLLAQPAGGSWAIGLIISEMLCLTVLAYLALTSREPTAEWIENRLRSELLRREQYLCLAGVGPYLLHQNPSDAATEALRRKGQIEGADTHSLITLVPVQETSGVTWLEGLHHKGPAKIPARADFIQRIESYLYYRIGKQIVWFANEIRDIQENEKMWSRLLTGALLAAIAVAGIHAFHLRTFNPGVAPEHDDAYWKIVSGTLAIVLPPLGTACLSVRAMYNFRGRSAIYEHEKSVLHLQRGALEALLREAKQSSSGTPGTDAGKTDFDFRLIALRTEQSLSFELTQWMLLMERREHEVAP